jgi:hypothetical protein
MSHADQIAADLRAAVANIKAPAEAVAPALEGVREANSFDAAMTATLAAIVALEDLENQTAAIVAKAQRDHQEVVAASAKAREALRVAMDACGGPGALDVETEHHRARLTRGGAKVEITTPDALPDDMWRMKREPDKALIKALLAKGQEIPGAALIQSPPTLVITTKGT